MAKSRTERLAAIKELIQHRQISQQEELVRLLLQRGFDSTQATISRDLKFLQITKTTLGNGSFSYILPQRTRLSRMTSTTKATEIPELLENENRWILGVQSIERSQSLVVIRTKPGYAGSIATDIDAHALPEVMGTIAGDDTILVIPRLAFSPEKVVIALGKVLCLPE
jgi:transcriptional regulator of arginine metabolism